MKHTSGILLIFLVVWILMFLAKCPLPHYNEYDGHWKSAVWHTTRDLCIAAILISLFVIGIVLIVSE